MHYHQWVLERRQVLATAAELLWLAVLAYVVSDGTHYFLVDHVVFMLGAVLAVLMWLVAVVNDLLRQPGDRLRYLISLRWPLWWVREPFVAVAAVVLFITPIAFLVRFSVSTPFVSVAAEAVTSGRIEPESFAGRRVGLWAVQSVDRAADAVRFKTGPCGLIDSCGFVYSPSGAPPVVDSDRYEHMWGPWWYWYRSL